MLAPTSRDLGLASGWGGVCNGSSNLVSEKVKETQEINGHDESYVDKWMGFDGRFEIDMLCLGALG